MRRKTKRTLASLVFTTFVFLSLFLALPAPAQAQFPIIASATVDHGNKTLTIAGTNFGSSPTAQVG
jgi:hypothetical protein